MTLQGQRGVFAQRESTVKAQILTQLEWSHGNVTNLSGMEEEKMEKKVVAKN